VDVDDADERVPAAAALVEEVSRLAGLADTGVWGDLGGGWSTNIQLAGPTGSGGVVFRVHQRFVTRDRLSAEQHIRCELAAAGLPTVPALPLFSGSTIARLASGNLVEVEPFVDTDAQMDTPDRLIVGFRLLGRLHDGMRASSVTTAAHVVTYANHLDPDVTVDSTRAGAARIASWGDPTLTRFAERVCSHVAEVCTLESAFAGEQRRQLVHGDYWDNNVLFADDRVAAVVDFGFMAERTRVDDLALPIWYLMLGRPDQGPSGLELVAAMLDAYDEGSEDPLSRAERLSLPLAVARQPAWMVGRWVPYEADEAKAEIHARRAADEFPAAVDVLGDLAAWQRALVT
jgi:homoserine kinase type II